MQNENIVCNIKNKKLTISVMESCTGGLLCSNITDIEGCSSVLIGGYVTYTNEQKIRCGVPEHIINKYGVYSKECSQFMATQAIENTQSSIGIGVTGSLGNVDTNNKDSIIGKIYYTIVIGTDINTYEISLTPDMITFLTRNGQKSLVVNKIIEQLNKLLEDNNNV